MGDDGLGASKRSVCCGCGNDGDDAAIVRRSSSSAIAAVASACSGVSAVSGDEESTPPSGPNIKGSAVRPGIRAGGQLVRGSKSAALHSAGRDIFETVPSSLVRDVGGVESRGEDRPKWSDCVRCEVGSYPKESIVMERCRRGWGEREVSVKAEVGIALDAGDMCRVVEPPARRSSTACRNSEALSVSVRRGWFRPLRIVGGGVSVPVSRFPEMVGDIVPWRDRAPAADAVIRGRLGMGPGAVRMPRPSSFTGRLVLEPRRIDDAIFNDSGSDRSYISKP